MDKTVELLIAEYGLRTTALKYAISLAIECPGATVTTTLAAAKEFEEYLKGAANGR